MKKLMILLLILTAGCTVSYDNNDTISWCDIGTITMTILGHERIILTTQENMSMPNNELIPMCCVETSNISKICTVNPEEYDDNYWGYTKYDSVESYTYSNETHWCLDVYNNSIMQSQTCYNRD